MIARGLPHLLALVGLGALGGCWSGPPILDASQAANVIPDGVYRLDDDEAGDRLRIGRQRDGSLLVTGAEQPWRVIVGSIDPGRKEQFVVQMQNAERPQRASYMLLDTSNKRLRLTILSCSGDARAAVERTGGTIGRDPQSAASCSFATRATLIEQLRKARPASGSDSTVELIPAHQ